MAVFECSRCNALTYSASRDAAGFACERCGCKTHRVIDEMSFDAARESPRVIARGDHAVSIIDSLDDALRVTAPFLVAGHEYGEHVVAQVSEELHRALEDHLGPAASDDIHWVAAGDVYGDDFNPDVAIARVKQIVSESDRPVRLLGGHDRDLSALAPLDEWRRYERLAHELVVDRGMTALCLYDRRLVDEDFVSMACSAHPIIEREQRLRHNVAFEYAAP